MVWNSCQNWIILRRQLKNDFNINFLGKVLRSFVYKKPTKLQFCRAPKLARNLPISQQAIIFLPKNQTKLSGSGQGR